VSKAPAAVIDKERTKLADMEMQLGKIQAQKAEIEAI
jgi:valyl-tRNA synthetase